MLEKLMALLDGELVPADGAAVMREVAEERDLEHMLAVCFGTDRRRVGRPYGAVLAEPVPVHLVDMIMRAPLAARRPAPARQTSYGRALLASLKNRYRVPGWSLAASHAMAALLVAAALGWMLFPTLGHGREVAAGLSTALEKGDGGKDFALAALRPVRTFKSTAGTWCRQFEVRYSSKHLSYGLACRDGDGTWPVVAATAPAPAVFAPAGDASPRKSIDDRAEAMKSGDAVTGDAERELVKGGWPSLDR
jgi:hypothetical protein